MVSSLVVHPVSQKALELFMTAPSHAIMLAGSQGLGKTHIAAAIAEKLLATKKAALINHAYYREIAPTKDTITIEQIRELIGFFRLVVPGTGAIKRIAVVQDADRMGIEAQNALLKLLEEPPEGSVLILTASRPQNLLLTIRSRVQIIFVQPPTEKALVSHFESQGHQATDIQQVLLRAGGNIAEASMLLEGSFEESDNSLQLVKQALGGTSYARLLMVDSLTRHKEQAIRFVDTLLQVATVSLEAAAKKQSTALSRWYVVLQASHTAQMALERNANTKLVLTDLMLSL